MARSKPHPQQQKDSESTQKQASKGKKKHPGTAVFSKVPRPFWTGIVAFGLVTLPVSLYPAHRGKRNALHMVDKTGARLNRRYICSKDQSMLSANDIVRGYEVEKDQFVTVDDDELKALAPEKSNEIDLQRFVNLEDIDPIYFDKSYFLAPDSDAIKAYRLLAESMAQENRAGIATFVMRDREYLVAIVSEAGILRAEILRFHDEVRAPDDVGLAEMSEDREISPKAAMLAEKMQETFKSLSATTLDRNQLEDKQTEEIHKKAQQKLQNKEDVVVPARSKKTAQRDDSDMPDSAEVIDLMQVIKARIKGETPVLEQSSEEKPKSKKSKAPGKSQATPTKQKGKSSARGTGRTLSGLSREELYARAQAAEVSGRSKMSKQQLIEALAETDD